MKMTVYCKPVALYLLVQKYPDLMIILPVGWTLEWLGCLSITCFGGEQVLQAFVNGTEGLPPLLEHKQYHSVLHQGSWCRQSYRI